MYESNVKDKISEEIVVLIKIFHIKTERFRLF